MFGKVLPRGVRRKDVGLQILTLCLITFPHLTSHAIVPHFLYEQLGPGWMRLWLVWFNVSCLSIYINYYLACNSDAGAQLDTGKIAESDTMLCAKCEHVKAARTHHCSVCRKCIKRQDHHCVWINNCVGAGNHAYFYRFLVSVTMTCTVLWWLMFWRFIVFTVRYQQVQYLITAGVMKPPIWMPELFMLTVNLFVVGLVILMVGILCGYQTYYIATNCTTIESMQYDRVMELWRREKLQSKPQYPYDVSVWYNLKCVMGRKWWLWWWPWYSGGDFV